MIWALQDRSYGLGNFINITPALKSLSEVTGEPVPVFFEIDYVRQCFIACPFITILDKQPYDRPAITSGWVDVRNHVPDYIFAYRELSKVYDLNPEAPHTYVDIPTYEEYPKVDAMRLFLYGSGNEDKYYMSKKTPSKASYQKYFRDKFDTFTGSETDFNRTDWFSHMVTHLGDIRHSLALIRDSYLIIANDTGLAHAAGAMNKDIIILWRNSWLPKNSNPGKNTIIKMCHES